MDVAEFKAGLKLLGWKQTDFALSIGVSKVTVSNWLIESSPNPLPKWAANYMLMLLKLHELRQHLTDGILEPPTKAIKAQKIGETNA
jgi:DNA-binding transcriptional regulator YiaG